MPAASPSSTIARRFSFLQEIMERQYVFIHDLSNQSLNWTIKIKVIRHSGPHLAKDGKTSYKCFTFVDEQGMSIQASIFGNDIEAFEHSLQPGKVYYISRGFLSKIKPEFRSAHELEHDFQMTIKKYTRVEEAEGVEFNTPTKKQNFLPLQDLPSLTIGHEYIDIVGIVVNVSAEEKRKRKYDSMEISFRNITVTDSSLQPVIISTWGRFIQNECEKLHQMLASRPIIVATNLQAKEIHGTRLFSTTASTDMLINPDIPESRDLETWKLNFHKKLDSLFQGNVTTSSVEPIVTIQHILTCHNPTETFCIKASIVGVLPQEHCWYMACSNCHRKTKEPYESKFVCQECQRENVTAEPWYQYFCPFSYLLSGLDHMSLSNVTSKLNMFCIRMELGDNSGSVCAVIFGQEAEKILSCKAESVRALNLEVFICSHEHFAQLEKWMTACVGREYVFRVKFSRTRNVDELRVVTVTDVT